MKKRGGIAMEKNQLIYVIEVARLGSITRAAEALHLSQPSLSNQIIHLEEELGVYLFERVRKRVYLTEAGQVFVDEAKKIVGSFESLGQLMGEYAQQRRGNIRIGALSIMCPLKIPELIGEFCKAYEGIDVSLVESGSAALLGALDRNEVDAVFALIDSGKGLPDNITGIHLFDSEVCAAVHESHELCGREYCSMKDLSGVPLIVNTGNFTLSSMILSRMESEGIKARATYTCNQIDSCLSLVNRNIGVSFCSQVTADYYQYPHVRLLPLKPAMMRTVSLVYRKNPEYYPALKTFLNFAAAFIREAFSDSQ